MKESDKGRYIAILKELHYFNHRMPFTENNSPQTQNQEYGFYVMKNSKQIRKSQLTHSKPGRNSELSTWTDEYTRKMNVNPFNKNDGNVIKNPNSGVGVERTRRSSVFG